MEQAVARRFRVARAPTLLAYPDAGASIAFTPVLIDKAHPYRTVVMPQEEAFVFHVALTPASSGEIWVNGKYYRVPEIAPGDTFLSDLSTNPMSRVRSPYDLLRSYIPAATVAYERRKWLHDPSMRNGATIDAPAPRKRRT